MADTIRFTRNFSDQSTNEGFQFEFYCDRCHCGHRTRFNSYKLGVLDNVLDAANGVFGGFLSRAADLAGRARSAAWEKAHDQAFEEASQEVMTAFQQCPRCQLWVCKSSCWNNERGLCKNCAPDLTVEMTAAQMSRTTEEIWAHSKVAEADREMLKESSWREGVRATCPECNAPIDRKAKFCPECGASIQAKSFCSGCGAELKAGAKFCPDCGQKVGG